MTATGLEAVDYSYDSLGNIISDGSRIFAYNLNNRLIKVSQGIITIAEYVYYLLNEDAFQYMRDKGLPKYSLSFLQASSVTAFTDSTQWESI